MSPLAFTPEPWRADQPLADGPFMIATPRGQLVAMVLRGVRMTSEEMEGNARLIACSPRMYRILRHIVDAVDEIPEAQPTPEITEIRELLVEIEAGI